MNATHPDTNTFPFHLSSTGMLHVQGCGNRHGRGIGRVQLITAQEATQITLRCKMCHPTPMGTEIPQTDRKTTSAATRQTVETDRREAHTAANAAWAAMQSPDLDALLKTFTEAEAAEIAGTGTFEAARDAFRAMNAAAPTGWSAPRRAKELA